MCGRCPTHAHTLAPLFPPPPTAMPPSCCADALGPLVWLLGLLNIAIAAFIEYLEKDEVPPKVAWNAAQTAAITGSLVILLVAVVLHLRLGSRRHLTAQAGQGALLSEEDEEDASFVAAS